MPTTEQKALTVEKKPSKSALGISVVSIIIAITAIGLSAHLFYQSYTNNQQFKTLSTAIDANVAQQTQQIRLLQNKISQLHNNQQSQFQHTMANVSYLVHFAHLNLAIGHHPTKALATLILVQNEVAPMQNDALTAFKNALNADIAALQAAPIVPTHQIFLQIATINEGIQKLSALPTQPVIASQNTIDATKSNDKSEPWYRRLLESLKQVKTLFIIRHLNEPSTPLVFPALEMTLKQNITTQLNMAQWALLHRDSTVYISALQTVSQWISQYFSLQPGSGPILNQITALEKIQINVALPTLNNTLTALSQINMGSTVGTVQPILTQPAPSVTNPAPPMVNPVTPDQKNKVPNTTDTQAPKNDESSVET